MLAATGIVMFGFGWFIQLVWGRAHPAFALRWGDYIGAALAFSGLMFLGASIAMMAWRLMP